MKKSPLVVTKQTKMGVSTKMLYGLGGVIIIAAVAGIIVMATQKGGSTGAATTGVEVSWPTL